MKKNKPLKFGSYPLIGYEYEYLGHPVRVVRVCPSRIGGERYSHIEFETRFADRSTCDSGELGAWQDIDVPLTSKQATIAMFIIRDAIEDATSDDELALAKWQLRRLMKQQRQSANA